MITRPDQSVTEPQRELLISLFRDSLKAVWPATCLQPFWPELPQGRLFILSLGKAAWPMARAACAHYGNDLEGLVLLPAGHEEEAPLPAGLKVLKGSHPVPDEQSMACANAAIAALSKLGKVDHVLLLLSGGGSSVLCKPREGITLAEKKALLKQLQRTDTSIHDLNRIRQLLSAVKGGRLIDGLEMPVTTLAISDVPGNSKDIIASGPTVRSQHSDAENLELLDQLQIDCPQAVRDYLYRNQRPAPAINEDNNFRVVGSGMSMLNAAQKILEQAGYTVINQGDRIQQNSRSLANAHAEIIKSLSPDQDRICLLSGGETSVLLDRQGGTGGRNTEYLLALQIALDGMSNVWAIACDSDGLDGTGGHSGAIIGPDSPRRAIKAGVNPSQYLSAHNSAAAFAATGELISEGPTLTNVNDFRAILVHR